MEIQETRERQKLVLCPRNYAAFKEVWTEIKEIAPNTFTGLEALEIKEFMIDPIKFKSA